MSLLPPPPRNGGEGYPIRGESSTKRLGSLTAVPSAIVTGSDSGIGKATAVRLARDGFDIGVTWHSDEAGARGPPRRGEGEGGQAGGPGAPAPPPGPAGGGREGEGQENPGPHAPRREPPGPAP